MIKEHPILFSTPMVQAILEGRKTQTRRVIKPQPIDNIEIDGNLFEGNLKGYVKVDGHPNWQQQFVHEFSNKKVGDLLWVKETFYAYGFWDLRYSEKKQRNEWFFNDETFKRNLQYKYAENPPQVINSKKVKGKDHCRWYKRPSIFMPKAAARIWLEITNIKVERLQDISGDDCIKEGIQKHEGAYKTNFRQPNAKSYLDGYSWTAKEEFQKLWQSINGAESWNANPFVWVISFKKINKPA